MIWFTADTHFGHDGILTHRLARRDDFDTIEAMDANIIDSFNAVVKRTDTLWHLGDFGWGAKKYGHYRHRLNVKKLHVTRGNHDRPSLRRHVSTLEMLVLRKFAAVKFVLCHYPIYSWPARVYGSIHLYGHCHTMAEKHLDEMMPSRRSVDVGVDNAYRLLGERRPFSLDEVLDMFAAREPISDELHRTWSDSGSWPTT